MPDVPASPRAERLAVPGWLDTRLVLGVLLVLVSVVVGARLLSSADRSSRVFVAVRDLEPGATLQEGDVEPQEVRLDAEQVRRLVPVPADGRPPEGYVALRPVAAGDLVPRSALVDERSTDLRQVTLNVLPGHAPPDLRSSQLVDVYVTPGGQAAGGPAPSPGAAAGSGPPDAAGPRLVLSAVPVAAAPTATSFGADQDRAVVLNVAPRDALTLVRAVAEGQIDLVRQLGRRSGPAADPTPVPTAGAG